jgi:hypothetical protein
VLAPLRPQPQRFRHGRSWPSNTETRDASAGTGEGTAQRQCRPLRSSGRVGWCEFSARLFLRKHCSCRADKPISAYAAPSRLRAAICHPVPHATSRNKQHLWKRKFAAGLSTVSEPNCPQSRRVSAETTFPRAKTRKVARVRRIFRIISSIRFGIVIDVDRREVRIPAGTISFGVVDASAAFGIFQSRQTDSSAEVGSVSPLMTSK